MMIGTELVKEIADWITEIGLDETTTGNYCIYFRDIAEKFYLSINQVKEHVEEIKDCFDYEVVADCEIDEESFGMWFYLEECCKHCDTYQNENRCYEECSSCDIWGNCMDEETDEEEE